MPRRLPHVRDGMLHLPAQPGQDVIVLGSADWFAWLDEPTTRSFTFEDARGGFTARKERRQRGTQYWIAYRKAGGKLRNAYLGKAADLTLARLEHAAAALAALPSPPGRSASPDHDAALAPAARIPRRAPVPQAREPESLAERHGSSDNVDTPPASANRSPPANNLPSPLTSFIGRERELAELCDLIGRPESAVRLLTLTGPGGTGKTRLGIAAAKRLLSDALDVFPNGIFYVPLSAIDDFNFVALAIAQTLGVRESGSRSLLENLYDFVRRRQLLLVLDNFEQVNAAAPLVAELLAAAHGLRIMVTSRALLQVYGEQEYPVPPLPLPDSDHLPPLAELAQNAAVTLFVERARAASLSFALNDANAAAVAAVCVRLDGLPLAIELAAARSKLFTPATMLARLNHSLAFLTGQTRGVAARQQTLRATIEWSYTLLADAEQTLFARLAVFVGGFTFTAAEVVCGDLNSENEELRNGDRRGQMLNAQFSVLNLVESLVNQSMIRQRGVPGPDGEPRFVLLLTLREYAWERLVAREEAEQIQRRHAGFFLVLAEQADSQLVSQHQRMWIAQLVEEYENLRAVLEWSLESRRAEDVEVGARLAGALWRFWWMQGRLGEGRTWLEAILRRCDALVETQPSIQSRPSFIKLRAQLLNGLGSMARGQADYAAARTFHEEGLILWQALGDKRGLASALNGLGSLAHDQSDHATARARYEESLALRRELGDTWGSALLLNNLGELAYEQRDFARAQTLQAESLSLMRHLGNPRGIAYALNSLGMVALQQGDLDGAGLRCEESLSMMREIEDRRGIATLLLNLGHVARARQDYTLAYARYAESLAVRREIGDKRGIGMSLTYMGFAALGQGDYAAARALLEESLVLKFEMEHRLGIAQALEGFASLAAQTSQPDRAARLFGAAEALRVAIGAPMAPADRAFIAPFAAAARGQLDPQAFTAAWAAGVAMSLDDAVACALERSAELGRLEADGPDRAIPVPDILLPLGTSDRVTTSTMAPSANLLPTKLYVPPMRPNLVPRPGLIARLDAGLVGKLTILAAPAGFGKTTLLSAWIAEKANGKRQKAKDDAEVDQTILPFTFSLLPFSVAWVSLDAGDNDPTRFWGYLSAALDTLYAGVAASVVALLQSSQPPTAETILTLLVTAISDRPPGEGAWRQGVLVLDDYHVITAPAIQHALATLIDYLPPHLHVVLATREDPPLPLARWRASGALTELRATDLRFTLEETALFLAEATGLPLSPDDVKALDSRTEGWVAGLQLAALAMRDQSDLASFIRAFSGSNRFVVDYLAAEVLDQLPAHLQAFVLQTSILDRMCGPLCDAVLGVDTLQRSNGATFQPANVQTAYSQIVLEELERANLFIVPLDDKRIWYRYHHLFAEVVRARLQSGTTSATLADLHRRASAWFERHGLVSEAVQQVLAAEDWEWAASLIERVAESMLNRGEYTTLQGWFEALPEELIRSRFPDFRLQIADVKLKQEQSPISNLQSATVEPLTPRELEVLQLLAAGRSNQAIADELVVAVGTVKRHVNSLCGKLGVPSRLAAVARARALGLL